MLSSMAFNLLVRQMMVWAILIEMMKTYKLALH